MREPRRGCGPPRPPILGEQTGRCAGSRVLRRRWAAATPSSRRATPPILGEPVGAGAGRGVGPDPGCEDGVGERGGGDGTGRGSRSGWRGRVRRAGGGGRRRWRNAGGGRGRGWPG